MTETDAICECPRCGRCHRQMPFGRPPLNRFFAQELYKAFERLGADSNLLSIIGSYGDTLEDSEVLQLLKDWNASGKVMQERQ